MLGTTLGPWLPHTTSIPALGLITAFEQLIARAMNRNVITTTNIIFLGFIMFQILKLVQTLYTNHGIMRVLKNHDAPVAVSAIGSQQDQGI